MAVLTIRNLDEDVKLQLRLRAAKNGRSMEEEARRLLRMALRIPSNGEIGLGEAIRRRFAGLGGVELELPPRQSVREPPDFSRPEYDRK